MWIAFAAFCYVAVSCIALVFVRGGTRKSEPVLVDRPEYPVPAAA
jgi:hypothetical protein